MENFRIPLEITLLDAPRDCSTVICHELIRHLPGKRIVCRGTWEGQAVAIKLLFQRGQSKRHWLRQERRTAALIQGEIPVPLPLYSGRYATSSAYPLKGYCIISTFIQGGKRLDEAWTTANAAEKRKALLGAALACLAGMHEKGFMQQDLHFQNFLIHRSLFYILDPDGISISKQPLGKRDSLGNVALFLAQLPPRYDRWAPQLVEWYVEMRGWNHVEAASEFFLSAIRKDRWRRVKKFLQKIFRESTHYASIENRRLFAVYRRELTGVIHGRLIRDPDAIVPSEKSGNLKRGNTCTVTKTALNGFTVVLKRYNIKNLLHGVSRAFRRTRAANAWVNAHLLGMLDIGTAAPLALVERRIGPIRRESFYLSCFVEGKNSKDFFFDTEISWGQKRQVADSILELFSSLARHRISHGDMKATNILIVGSKVVLVDLDALRQHRLTWTFRRSFEKDIARFMRNWDDDPKIQGLFKEKLSAFTSQRSVRSR